jgi:transposase-like protein/IS1 family transposase
VTCHCCSGECKKAGFHQNKNRAVQRYKCLRCGKNFGEVQPLDGVRIETAKAAQVIAMLFEGIGINAICRLTQLNKHTILNVLESAGAHCERLLASRIVRVKVEQVEIDELFSYVQTRQHFAEANDPERGAFYCYLSIDRDTKLIINHHVGKRTREDSRTFIAELKQRTDGERFQLSSDGFSGYRGHDGAVFHVFKNEIDYGTEVKMFAALVPLKSSNSPVPKKFNPIVCKSVRRTVQIGVPDKDKINTSRAERLNLTMRLFNRRFTRCTLGYSKKIENHAAAVALYIMWHNFGRKHQTLGTSPTAPWDVRLGSRGRFSDRYFTDAVATVAPSGESSPEEE